MRLKEYPALAMTKITKNASHCLASPSARHPPAPTAIAAAKSGFLRFLLSEKAPKNGPESATIKVAIDAAYPQ